MAIFSQAKLNILLFALLCVGIGSGLSFKYQSRSVVLGEQYNHPFMQTMLMFIGEALCYFQFLIYKSVFKKQYQSDKAIAQENGLDLNPSQFKFFLASFLDFAGSTFSFFAMGLMPLAIYYMLKGGTIVMTAIFSVFFLKRILYKHHYLGLFLTVVGFVVIGLLEILTNSDSSKSESLFIGIILLVISFIFGSAHLCLEEKFFHNTFLNAFQGIGYEGFWGIIITWVSLNIVSHIRCPSFMMCPNGMMEDSSQFFRQVFTIEGDDQPILIISIFTCIFFVYFVNGLGLTITQHASALSRSLLGAVTPLIIWVITIGLGWDSWNYGRFGGYIIITLGCLIYNEILVLPCFGLNEYTRKNIEKRQKKIEEELKNKTIQEPIDVNDVNGQL